MLITPGGQTRPHPPDPWRCWGSGVPDISDPVKCQGGLDITACLPGRGPELGGGRPRGAVGSPWWG